jgi:polysaccharide deacetylase 2 family uncharacterized protein YibQ
MTRKKKVRIENEEKAGKALARAGTEAIRFGHALATIGEIQDKLNELKCKGTTINYRKKTVGTKPKAPENK